MASTKHRRPQAGKSRDRRAAHRARENRARYFSLRQRRRSGRPRLPKAA